MQLYAGRLWKGRSILSRATENGPAFRECFVRTQRSAGPLLRSRSNTSTENAAARCLTRWGRSLVAELAGSKRRVAELEEANLQLNNRITALHELAADKLPRARQDRVHYADQILAAVHKAQLKGPGGATVLDTQ